MLVAEQVSFIVLLTSVDCICHAHIPYWLAAVSSSLELSVRKNCMNLDVSLMWFRFMIISDQTTCREQGSRAVSIPAFGT